jgi:Trk K+ transport system NAD-binding subunit
MPVIPDGNTATAGAAYADWRGHVIVRRLGGVGLRIVEQLTLSGVPAVVVGDDPDPPLAQMIEAWGVPLVTGASRSEEVLMSAGLAGAIAVIGAQHDDLRALETALLAHRLRPGMRVVAQITNPAVGRAVKEAGVAVLDVAGLSAPSVVEACLREGAQEMTLSGERFLAVRTTAPRAASLRELYGDLGCWRSAGPRTGRCSSTCHGAAPASSRTTRSI